MTASFPPSPPAFNRLLPVFQKSEARMTGLGLWVPNPREVSRAGQPPDTTTGAALTVAVLDASATAGRIDGVVPALADLAATDELVLLYGRDDDRPWHGLGRMLAGLRERLPRHKIVSLQIEARTGVRGPVQAMVEEILEDGCLPVVATASAALSGIAAQFAARLQADRVLTVTRGGNGAASLRQVWVRRQTPRQPALAAS